MTLQEKLALACRILAMQGHKDLIYGHVSALTDTPGQYWIKGSGLGLEEVTEDDLVLIDFEGNKISGKRPRHNEFPIHSEVYRTNYSRDSLRHSYAPGLFHDHRVLRAPAAAAYQYELRLLPAGAQEVRGIVRSHRDSGARHRGGQATRRA